MSDDKLLGTPLLQEEDREDNEKLERKREKKREIEKEIEKEIERERELERKEQKKEEKREKYEMSSKMSMLSKMYVSKQIKKATSESLRSEENSSSRGSGSGNIFSKKYNEEEYPVHQKKYFKFNEESEPYKKELITKETFGSNRINKDEKKRSIFEEEKNETRIDIDMYRTSERNESNKYNVMGTTENEENINIYRKDIPTTNITTNTTTNTTTNSKNNNNNTTHIERNILNTDSSNNVNNNYTTSNNIPTRGTTTTATATTTTTTGVQKNDYKIRIKCFNKYLKYNVHKIYEGQNFLYSLQTNELLKMIQKKEAANYSQSSKSGFAQYRDIRQLVSNNTNTRFDISPKRNCVLLNLPYRKCIIFKDALYYIPTFTNNPASEVAKKEERMCEYFIENAKVISLIKGSLPFEILILEAIFVDVCDELKNEIDPVVAEAEKLFEVISSNLSVYKRMNKLTEMRRKLQIIDEKVQSVYKSIQTVLNNDEDVKRLEVSYFWNRGDLWDKCGNRTTPNYEDTEMLLEYYSHEIEEFLKTIRRTDESLDDLLQMVELNLDDARNNVLKLELGLKIYGIIISVVGTIAAIFGMNIKNGFENDEMIFWGFAFLLILVSFFCLFYVFVSFKKVNI